MTQGLRVTSSYFLFYGFDCPSIEQRLFNCFIYLLPPPSTRRTNVNSFVDLIASDEIEGLVSKAVGLCPDPLVRKTKSDVGRSHKRCQ